MSTPKGPHKTSRKDRRQRGQAEEGPSRKQSNSHRERSVASEIEGAGTRRAEEQETSDLISQQPIGAALINSAIGVAVTNAEGHFLLVNEPFCQITGYSEQELLSLDWLALSHPDPGKSNALTWRIEAYKVPGFSVEKRCIRKDGRDLWLRSSLSSLHDRKQSLFIALVEDFTDQKRAELALAAKEVELREALRLAQLGNWQWDPDTDAMVWSDEVYRAVAYDPKLPPPSFREHRQFFTPDSWDRLNRCVEEALRTGVPYEIELQVIRPDDSRLWVTSRGEAVRDNKSGRITRLRGTVQDITTRKRAEEALLKSEEKFIKAFNAVPVAVNIVTVAEGRQIEVNDALLQMAGYRRDEVIGRLSSELGYWDNLRDRQVLVERLLAGEHLRNVESRFRRRNGEPFTGLASADLIELNGQQCIVTAVMDISELRRAEQSVRDLQSKLELHFQQTMLGVIEFDPRFIVNEWNSAAETIFEYSRQEAVGRDVRTLIVPEDSREQITALIAGSLREGKGRYSTNRNKTKQGRQIICDWFNTPLVQQDGAVSGVIALVRDVTAEKTSQAELAASEATLDAVFQSTDDSIWTVDAERFGLMTFNSAASEGFAKERGAELRAGMTPDDLVAPELAEWWRQRYRQALTTGTFETDYVGIDGVNVFRLSFFPLRRDEQVFGVSVFARNVTKRQRAEQELQFSEERYRQLVASSSDWVWEVDDEAHYTYASPQCHELLGYAPEEITGKTPFDLMPQKEAERVARLFRNIAAQRKPFRGLENINLHKNGHPIVLETNGVPIIDREGRFCGYRGMDRDITQWKQTETALRESEERYRSLADNLPGVVFQLIAKDNGRWGFYFVHENSRDLLGIEAEPFESWNERFVACLDADDQRRVLASIQQAIAAAATWEFETKFTKPTGEEIYIRGVSKPRRHENELFFHGILLDITSRKCAEKALRDSDNRLHLALESGRMYAFEWDPRRDTMTRSPEYAAAIGIPGHPAVETGEEFLDRLHPEDRWHYLELISNLSPAEDSYQTQYRKVFPSGKTRWIEARGRGFFDEDGKLVRIVGVAADVTERKEADDALRTLSAFLINAQEDERKRVARELHDGVSQALAVISIQMAQAANAASGSELSSKLEKLYEGLQRVLKDIGHLSHELHPSTLKHLGLSAAMRVLCEEITQAHGIEVDFNETSAPRRPSKDLALCFYRVAQEALQNIVKHGRCDRAWVELGGNHNEISLHIWDGGVGFDTQRARAGLGLVSMRERVRLLGGRIDITSKRGFGTSIEVCAPLERDEPKAAA